MIEESILNRLADRLARALAAPDVPLARFVVEGSLVGEITLPRAQRLRGFRDVFEGDETSVRFVPGLDDPRARTEAMAHVARTLAAEGALTAWRDEQYAVAGPRDRPPLFLLERAAARYFGVGTCAVHVNGSTMLGDGVEAMWLGRRSPRKAIDPGQLDNMVGGGIAHGADVASTLAKEAWEEAGLGPDLVARAVPAGALSIRRLQPDGVQRESIFVHDVVLPGDAMPVNQDGEVAAFRLARPDEVALLAGNEDGPDVVTADASLVAADWLVRRGFASTRSALARALRVARGAASTWQDARTPSASTRRRGPARPRRA